MRPSSQPTSPGLGADGRVRPAVIIDSMVTFCGPVTAGTITKPAAMIAVDLAASGYVEEEFLAQGSACGYDVTGEAGPDGRWTAVPAETEPYRTRVLVRRPADAARFAGLVLGGLRPARVLAIGESQSAIYLTSFINAVQAFSPIFDGFLVHSRGAGAAALSGEPIDPPNVTQGVRIRDDG